MKLPARRRSPDRVEAAVLNYRYRLWPTPQQEAALSTSMGIARRAWNAMVSLRLYALDQCRRGREASIRRELVAIEATKKPVGMRAAKMRRLAEELGDASVEASMHAETVARVAKMSRWILAQEFAIARAAQAKTKKSGSDMGKMWAQVAIAFGLACKALKPGRRLRFRRRDESAPLRIQHQAALPVRQRQDGVSLADLGALIEADKREALRWMRFEAHRELPAGAKVTQIALTCSRLGWHVVFTVTAAVAKAFPEAGGRAAGVDPGRSIALTVAPADSKDHGQSDGFELCATRGQKRLLRRVARLARKADRQRRAANPECYRADGTIIRGQRPRRTSKGLEATLNAIAGAHAQFRARRTEFYHLAAGELLKRFDRVQVGNWVGLVPGAAEAKRRNAKLIERITGSPAPAAKPRARGVRARERGQRRRDAGNAIAEFKRILCEKAALSVVPKTVVEVREHGSTRTCPACGADSGPRGIEQLGMRRWTCGSCGKNFRRDRAAAYQLAVRPAEQAENTLGYGAARSRSKAGPQRARVRAVGRQPESATAPTECVAPRERSGVAEVSEGRSRPAKASGPGSRESDSLERTRSSRARVTHRSRTRVALAITQAFLR